MNVAQYRIELASMEGRCHCQALADMDALEDRKHVIQRECHFMKREVDSQERKDWQLFWDHKTKLRDLEAIAQEHSLVAVKLIELGHIRIFLHRELINGLWEKSEVTFEQMELALKLDFGFTTLHCAQCAQLIAISAPYAE
jgi:hypothetical protein